jgi:hypothetical protein
MKADSLIEVILFYSLAYTLKITENHFTELEETTFFPSLLVHFRESFHRISGESLLSKKLFGRAPAGSTENQLGSSTMTVLKTTL